MRSGWAAVLCCLVGGCSSADESAVLDPPAKSVPAEASPSSQPPAKVEPPAKPSTHEPANALGGEVAAAPPDVKGFDTFASVTEKAPAIAAAGYGFAVRYVMLEASKTNLTREEAQAILDAGMALMIVQQGAEWKDRKPSTTWGERHGEAAQQGANAVGYPSGAVLWLDLESVKQGDASDVRDYVTAWRSKVEPQYAAGLYVGPNVPLTQAELASLGLAHYWKSGVTHLEPEGIGYQITQHAPVKVDGVEVDVDRTVNDARGGAARWLQPKGWTAPSTP